MNFKSTDKTIGLVWGLWGLVITSMTTIGPVIDKAWEDTITTLLNDKKRINICNNINIDAPLRFGKHSIQSDDDLLEFYTPSRFTILENAIIVETAVEQHAYIGPIYGKHTLILLICLFIMYAILYYIINHTLLPYAHTQLFTNILQERLFLLIEMNSEANMKSNEHGSHRCIVCFTL